MVAEFVAMVLYTQPRETLGYMTEVYDTED